MIVRVRMSNPYSGSWHGIFRMQKIMFSDSKNLCSQMCSKLILRCLEVPAASSGRPRPALRPRMRPLTQRSVQRRNLEKNQLPLHARKFVAPSLQLGLRRCWKFSEHLCFCKHCRNSMQRSQNYRDHEALTDHIGPVSAKRERGSRPHIIIGVCSWHVLCYSNRPV